MLRVDPATGTQKWYRSDSAKSVLSAIISILIGMVVGTLIILIVGLTKDGISGKGIWEGIRLVFLGVFSTGRDGGALTFGYNPVNLGNMLFRATPLVMTGLSVAVAFKTGLFNIGAAGQYLMGTMGTLTVGLTLGNTDCPVFIAWLAAFMAVCVYLIQWLGLPDYVTLLIQVPVGAVIFIGGSALLKLEAFTYLWGMVKPVLMRMLERFAKK